VVMCRVFHLSSGRYIIEKGKFHPSHMESNSSGKDNRVQNGD